MMTETVVTVQEAPHNNSANKPDQNALGWLRLNVDYFKTIPGILKLVQLIFGIICMSLASPAYLSGTHWFLFVVTTSFIATIVWVFIYFLSIREALHQLPINWLLTELLNTSIATIFYVIAFIVQLCVWSPNYAHFRAANIAAGVFGLFNTLAYGAGAYLLYIEWKGTQTNA